MKTKKDKLFIMVSAVVLGNLAYNLWNTLSWLITYPKVIFIWALALSNIIAVIGLMWLMRDYVKRQKAQNDKKDTTTAQ